MASYISRPFYYIKTALAIFNSTNDIILLYNLIILLIKSFIKINKIK